MIAYMTYLHRKGLVENWVLTYTHSRDLSDGWQDITKLYFETSIRNLGIEIHTQWKVGTTIRRA